MRRLDFLKLPFLAAVAAWFTPRGADAEAVCARCGGSGLIAYERSRDAGVSWRSGHLPDLVSDVVTKPCPVCRPRAIETEASPKSRWASATPLEGRLRTRIAQYEEYFGERPEYFWCSRETLDALWTELAGRATPRGGYQQHVYDGVVWYGDSSEAGFGPAEGDFECFGSGYYRSVYDERKQAFPEGA